jgi:heterodisulfide reductase subunit A
MIANGEGLPANAGSVVMIQCVGSRDEKRPYCSRTCCGQAIKNACKLKELNPQNDVYVLYRDVRTYGSYEKRYREARELGVIFVHYEPHEKPVVTAEGGRLLVTFCDPVINEQRAVEADLLVLSSGIAANPDNRRLAEIGGLDLTEDGFFAEASPKAAPLDSVKRGIYFCGLCHSPNYSEQVICQARAAAARASALLWKGHETLPEHQAYVNERRCSGCGLCVTACPYHAREIDEVTGKARVLVDVCSGCGTCAVVCPNGASQQHGFESAAILEEVDTVVG